MSVCVVIFNPSPEVGGHKGNDGGGGSDKRKVPLVVRVT